MKVKIKKSGQYASFPYTGRFVKFMGPRQFLEVGDEVDFPPHYALGLEEVGLVDVMDSFRQGEGEVTGEVQITSAARNLAEEHGLSPDMIDGTGSGGKVTLDDVKKAIGEAKI